MNTRSTAARLAPWLLLALMGLGGHAQAEDDKRSAQLREAARRAQAAAQQAQQEAASLRAERDKLGAADAQRQAELAKAQAQGRSATAQLAAARNAQQAAEASNEQLRKELASMQAERDTLNQQLAKLQTQWESSQQALAEQQRITQATVALLGRSVKTLAEAEEANRQLQALGLQAVAAYETATPEAARARDLGFMGIASVRLTDQAEQLRRAMAGQRLVP